MGIVQCKHPNKMTFAGRFGCLRYSPNEGKFEAWEVIVCSRRLL